MKKESTTFFLFTALLIDSFTDWQGFIIYLLFRYTVIY